MIKTFALNTRGIQQFAEYLKSYRKSTGVFFNQLGMLFHALTMLTFRTEGARPGHGPWRDFATNTLINPETSTWKIRYGTDLRPLGKEALSELRKKWGYGRRGYMRGDIRRYSANSKLLQASGSFMRSFKKLSSDSNEVTYGTEFHTESGVTAQDIIKDREVLFLVPQDYLSIRRQFSTFIALALNSGGA